MKCKKITFENPINKARSPHILLGVVIEENDYFYYFKTKNKEYTIAKRIVLSLSETNEEFIGGDL